jgi:putative DNA primase/helicase
VPAVVLDATADYLADQDALSQWLDDCTIREKRAFTTTSKLFKSWKSWAEHRNQFVGTMVGFAADLADRGFEHDRKEYGRGFNGIVLKPQDGDLL